MYKEGRRCALCGAENGAFDLHHVFGGSRKKLSEQYGAMVWLCHESCHERGKDAVHNNAAVALKLKQEHQLRIMTEQGWDEDDFRAVFGKSWLTEEGDRA